MATVWRASRRVVLKPLALLGGLTAALLLVTAAADPGVTTRVSVDSAGAEANGSSYGPAVSDDGSFVAFSSLASNLTSDDTNGRLDVFIHDRKTSTTTSLSVGTASGQGNDESLRPAVSDGGRFVAFDSRASNLVPDDTNEAGDVFVHDRQTGLISRVSVDSAGGQGNDDSYFPAISGDGRFVAFHSRASNLVSGDGNGRFDIFVHDRQTGTTTRASLDSNGVEGNANSADPKISDDGRFVAFASKASNLVAGDTNGSDDVFVHDSQTGVTERVSIDSAGVQGNSSSRAHAISDDGRFVAFASLASNLVVGDTNATIDVFVHDRQTGVTERISVDSAGAEGDQGSHLPAISGDGRFVTFESSASNLVSADSNGGYDIFVHDRQTSVTQRVSIDSAGDQVDAGSFASAISNDGLVIAFRSSADTLVTGDSNNTEDIFVHDVSATPTPPATKLPGTGGEPHQEEGSFTRDWLTLIATTVFGLIVIRWAAHRLANKGDG